MNPSRGPDLYNAFYGEYAPGQWPDYTIGELTHVLGPSPSAEYGGGRMLSAGPHPTGDDGRPTKRPAQAL